MGSQWITRLPLSLTATLPTRVSGPPGIGRCGGPGIGPHSGRQYAQIGRRVTGSRMGMLMGHRGQLAAPRLPDACMFGHELYSKALGTCSHPPYLRGIHGTHTLYSLRTSVAT